MASNMKRKDRRKKQTRLTFDPVDPPTTFSPTHLTPAKVRYEHPDKTRTPAILPPKFLPTRTTRSSGQRRQTQIDTHNYRDHVPSFSSPTPRQTSVQISEEDSDDVTPLRRRKRQVIQKEEDSDGATPLKRSKPQVSMVEEEDSDDVTPLKRRRRPTPEEEEEDSDILPSPRKLRRKVSEGNGDDSDSDLPYSSMVTSKNRRSSPGSSDANDRYTRQKITRRHRTEKEKQLEMLRRRRAGEKDPELTPSESDSDESDSNLVEALSKFDDEEEEEVVEKSKARPSRPQPDTNGSDEDDFIIEDDEENLGVPRLDMPLEFTNANNKPEKEHFKDVVEWFVHKKLNPAFPSKDPVYIRGFQKLNHIPATLRSSKYGSSQWTADFNTALDARPVLQERRLGPGEGLALRGEIRCEACNRGSHPTSYAIQFGGKAYDKDTLEEIQQGDNDDESGSDDSRSVDCIGRLLPNEEKEWLSGRFCRDKAQKAHLLAHWKYHLNEWVLGTLEVEGELDADQLVRREKMKSWEKKNHANNVVDRWEETGKLRTLYEDYKNQISELEEARELGRWGRGD